MSTLDYDRLLNDLAEARKASAGENDTVYSESAERLARLEDRLLSQQADLVHLATTLHLKVPKLQPRAEDEGTARDCESACLAADREADNCENAAQRTRAHARLPSFLPTQRPFVRHMTVYLLCAVAAVAVESLAVLANGFAKASWVFAAAPLTAFAVGYLVIGKVGRPLVLPSSKRQRRALLPTRDPKPGLMLCLLLSVATAAWWMLS